MTKNSKALIGAIKAGQSWLGWDDSTYRSVLLRLTGKDSSTRCSLDQLQSVREYMHEQGYPRKTSPKHGRKPKVAAGRQGILGKIEALLTDAGRKWDYAEAVALRMFDKKTLEWLTDEQLTKLMQALIMDNRRRK